MKLYCPRYKVGTRLYIVNAGDGALGANKEEGVVVGEEAYASSGLFETDSHFKVKLKNGIIWSVSSNGNYEVIKREKKSTSKCKKSKSKLDENTDIERVIHHRPLTVVIWTDGSVTTSCCQDGDSYDKEKGFLVCVGKKFFGSNSSLNRRLDKYC